MPGKPTEDADPSIPRRVLVVSANVGAGHDAAGRALHEQVNRLWPGSRVAWIDALAGVSLVGRVSRPAYAVNMAAAPWLYGFFYASLWRHRRFSQVSKRLCGAVTGRWLAPVIERVDPDLIVSTHPIGTAGLAWLRRHRGLGVPIGAWLVDFAPHPFWIYPEVDLNLVSHQSLVPVALAAAPGAAINVCGPPVADRFGPGDQGLARRRNRLDEARPVVLVAGGSFGLGAVAESVQVLTAHRGLQVVAVCGHNRRLARRLESLGLPPQVLRVLGWVDDLSGLMRAADLVVTYGSGATAHEALATGTPVVMYRPIAGHGVTTAAMLTACGLAETGRTPAELTALVTTRLAGRAAAPAALPRAAHLGLPALAAAPRVEPAAARVRSWPTRPQDAFFRYIDTPTVTQQLGVVLEVGPLADGRPLTKKDLVTLLAQRLPVLPALRRYLVRRGGWRRPGWRLVARVDPAQHIDEHHTDTDPAAAIDRFWSQPLPTDRPPWHVLVVTGLPEGRAKVAIKLHHCLGDGGAAIGTLARLLDPPPADRSPTRLPPQRSRPYSRAAAAVRQGVLVMHGLARLAVAGPAPRSLLNRPLATPHRRLVSTTFPASEVDRAARAHRVHPSELIAAVVAGALRGTYPGPPPPRLRALFPVTRRERAQTQGNWTAAVSLDLPLADMPTSSRAIIVRDRLRRGLAGGEPSAAALAMRLMGTLPGPVHATLARLLYSGRFLNVIVSYLSTTVAPQRLAGAPVEAVIPVVPLADRVPVGVAVLRVGEHIGVGVLLDASLSAVGDAFITALHDQLTDLGVRDGAFRCG